jgi:hypothetical protein
MTLDEIDHLPPNGFHDGLLSAIELDYKNARATLHLDLCVGWPDDPESERSVYQKAVVTVTGLFFCAIQPPDPNYPFVPDGSLTWLDGDPAKPDHLPSLPELMKKAPDGTWAYRFFMGDWNSFIYIAARDAALEWVGEKPKHAQ